MSATATTAFVVVVMLVIAAFVIAALVVASAATTTAASTCHMLNQVLNLLVGSLAVLNHLTLEVQGFACQWVVGINGNTVFLDLYHLSHELMVLVVHQGDNSALEDVVVIEMTVNGKYLAANLVNALSYILAECLSRSQLEIKVAALFKTFSSKASSATLNPVINSNGRSSPVCSSSSLLPSFRLYNWYTTDMNLFFVSSIIPIIYIFSFSLQSYAFSAKYTNV